MDSYLKKIDLDKITFAYVTSTTTTIPATTTTTTTQRIPVPDFNTTTTSSTTPTTTTPTTTTTTTQPTLYLLENAVSPAAANGNYVEDGIVNDHMSYVHVSGGYYLYWTVVHGLNQWHIFTSKNLSYSFALWYNDDPSEFTGIWRAQLGTGTPTFSIV